MNIAKLVQGEDWEGLYINDKLVKEGHTLNEGYSRFKVFKQLAKQYDFNLDEMKEYGLSDKDNEITNDIGNFPEDINLFCQLYEN